MVGSLYTNPFNFSQLLSIPNEYGGGTSNPVQALSSDLGVNQGALSSLLMNYWTNPQSLFSSLPAGPAYAITPSLTQMASLQGTPLSLADLMTQQGGGGSSATASNTANTNAGMASQVTNPAISMLNQLMPNYYKNSLGSVLSGSGEASGTPGGQNVFDATATLKYLLPAEQWASTPYLGTEQTLANANIGNAGYMSQAANQFTNNVNYQKWMSGLQAYMNAVGGLANGVVQAALRPNQTTWTQGQPAGGTNYMGSWQNPGSGVGSGGGGGSNPGVDPLNPTGYTDQNGNPITYQQWLMQQQAMNAETAAAPSLFATPSLLATPGSSGTGASTWLGPPSTNYSNGSYTYTGNPGSSSLGPGSSSTSW